MKKQLQKGFTLIELMIVVAIIGILASIALPAYQDYMARAQATEGVTLMAGLKPTITEVYSDAGSLAGITSATNGLPAADDVAGKYVDSVAVLNGVITATFADTGVSTELQGTTLRLTPVDTNGILVWSCATTAPLKLVPNSCRTAYTL